MAKIQTASQKEAAAYKKVKAMLGGAKAPAFAKPAGLSNKFPDFGFRVKIDGKKVDVFFEYKSDARALMGSMTDWIFDGSKFKTKQKDDEDKQDLIDIMNINPVCTSNGKRILDDLKRYFDPSVTSLYSGSLTVIKDQKERKAQAAEFKKYTRNLQIANIENASMGDRILTHYKNKFHKEVKGRNADYSILYMMIGDEIFFIDSAGMATSEISSSLQDMFNATSKIPTLKGLRAKLEVRVTLEGLNISEKNVFLSVKASYRLASKPMAGTRI